MVELGGVYRLYLSYVTPPSDKFLICIAPQPQFFKINSQINPFLERNPHLRIQQVPVERRLHGFLQYDSWLDCSEPYAVSTPSAEEQLSKDPTRHIGDADPSLIRAILDVVAASRTLPERKKVSISAALKTLV